MGAGGPAARAEVRASLEFILRVVSCAAVPGQFFFNLNLELPPCPPSVLSLSHRTPGSRSVSLALTAAIYRTLDKQQ